MEFKNFKYVRFFNVNNEEYLIDIDKFSFDRFCDEDLECIADLDRDAEVDFEGDEVILKACLYVYEYEVGLYNIDECYLMSDNTWE